jgi:hypothetical protein
MRAGVRGCVLAIGMMIAAANLAFAVDVIIDGEKGVRGRIAPSIESASAVEKVFAAEGEREARGIHSEWLGRRADGFYDFELGIARVSTSTSQREGETEWGYATVGLDAPEGPVRIEPIQAMSLQVQRKPVRSQLVLTMTGGLRTLSKREDQTPAARFRVHIYADAAAMDKDALETGEGSLFEAEVTLGRTIVAGGGLSPRDFILQKLEDGSRTAQCIGSVVKVVPVPDVTTAVIRVSADTDRILEAADEPEPVAQEPSTPAITMLWSPRPNPASRDITLRFSVAQRMQARLAVFDLQGRKVATLVDRIVDPGPRSFTWDRADSRGSRSKSGIYFARFEADGKSFTKRFVLLR